MMFMRRDIFRYLVYICGLTLYCELLFLFSVDPKADYLILFAHAYDFNDPLCAYVIQLATQKERSKIRPSASTFVLLYRTFVGLRSFLENC